jgi:hypothetical protein
MNPRYRRKYRSAMPKMRCADAFFLRRAGQARLCTPRLRMQKLPEHPKFRHGSLVAKCLSLSGTSHEGENETHCNQSVESGHHCTETNVGHNAFRRELDLSGRHRTSPPQLQVDHAQRRKSFPEESRLAAQLMRTVPSLISV